MDETPADDTTPDDTTPEPRPAVPQSPWAAPTLPAPVPPAPEATAPPFTSVVITEPPRKSRVGLLVAAAVVVVVVAAVGVGAFLMLRGGDEPVTFSLQAAADRTAAAPGRTSVIETVALGQTLAVDSTLDDESGLAKVSMDLSKIIGTDTPMVAIVDPENKTMYMSADAFGAALADVTDKAWVKVDQQALDDAGQDSSMFDQLGAAGKIDVEAVIAHADTITDLGATTFDGEDVRHYEVIAKIADVPGLKDLLQNQIEGLDAVLPDELIYDMYVTKDNEIRRVVYEMDLTTSKVTVDTTMHLLDTAPGITIPPDDDVIDARDLG